MLEKYTNAMRLLMTNHIYTDYLITLILDEPIKNNIFHKIF